MKRKKICMIAYTHYATDPRVKREAEALAETAEVDVITLSSKTRRKYDRGNLSFHYVGLKRFRAAKRLGYIISYFKFTVKVFLKLNVLDRRRKYDIVYFHTMPDFIVFAGIIQKLKRKKIVLDIHDLFPELYAIKFGKDTNSRFYRFLVYLERICAAMADVVVSVHHPHQKRLVMRGIKKPIIIMNVPDTAIFNVSRRRAPRQFKFVFHGTISRRLGMDMILEAAKKLRVSGEKDILFYVIGVGEYAEGFSRRIKEAGLADIIEFRNEFYPIEELPDHIGDAFAGIVPYENNIVHNYSLSVKMLEYVAMKIPVITADLPSTRFYFKEDQIAYYQSRDVDNLCRQITRLVREPEKAVELAERAFHSFCPAYNWDTEKKKLQDLIESL